MSAAIEFDRVSIVFGDAPQTALPLLDQGQSREEVQRATGQVAGVHECSLSVEEGEILVLMGLSGSGKSTLLRAVNALSRVTRGEVRLKTETGLASVTHADPATLRALRQKQVAMVFQQFALLPWRNVRENVGLGLELRGLTRAERRARVDEELRLVNLIDRAEALVGELSGGMQQRVGLARAFATDAPILLMDEPFSALDPLIRTRLQGELLAMQKARNRTILFVSHDLEEAFRIGNRIAMMEGGRIIQTGTPREIFTTPANDHIAEFVSHLNPLSVLTAGDVMGPARGATGTTVTPDTPLGKVLARLKAGPVPVEGSEGIVGEVTGDRVLDRLVAPRG